MLCLACPSRPCLCLWSPPCWPTLTAICACAMSFLRSRVSHESTWPAPRPRSCWPHLVSPPIGQTYVAPILPLCFARALTRSTGDLSLPVRAGSVLLHLHPKLVPESVLVPHSDQRLCSAPTLASHPHPHSVLTSPLRVNRLPSTCLVPTQAVLSHLITARSSDSSSPRRGATMSSTPLTRPTSIDRPCLVRTISIITTDRAHAPQVSFNPSF